MSPNLFLLCELDIIVKLLGVVLVGNYVVIIIGVSSEAMSTFYVNTDLLSINTGI